MAAVGGSGSGGGGGSDDPYIFEIDEGATRALYGGNRYGYVGQPPREWFASTVFRAGEPVSETAARSGTGKSRRIEAPYAEGFVPGIETLPDRPHEPAIGRRVETPRGVGHAEEGRLTGPWSYEIWNYDDYGQYVSWDPGEEDNNDNYEYLFDRVNNQEVQLSTWTAAVYPENPPVDVEEDPPTVPGMARIDLMMRQLGFK